MIDGDDLGLEKSRMIHGLWVFGVCREVLGLFFYKGSNVGDVAKHMIDIHVLTGFMVIEDEMLRE